MTDNEFSSEFAPELLDDFYTECDEQLGVLRDCLAEFEASAPDSAAPTAFEPLFRTMHSLKGNAAIVGLRAAEELAHIAENYLRALMRGELKLSDAGRGKLGQTVHRLESIIGAHRRRTAIPAVSDLVAELKALVASDPASNATPETAPTLDAAATRSETPTAAPAPEPSNDPAFSDEQGASLFIAPSHVVRVDIGRLDDLLRIAGELVIHRSRLEDRLNQGVTDRDSLKEVNLALTRSLRELREAITRVRLVPVAEVFSRLPFVVRDLAQGAPQKARLLIEGKHTEIDKFIVERLKDPLLHLVRNAFSHGIETPEARVAAGKPPEGTIVLSAAAEGGFVVIKIHDDGCGVDSRRVVARAEAMKLPVPPVIDDKALLDLLCAPGFSTREETDRAAGRGMGMSVVRDAVQELGGNLSFQSVPGRGSQFTLRLPLTLSIVETVLFSVAGQTCAVPQNLVQEIVEVPESSIKTIQQTLIVPYRDGVLPIVRLGKFFNASHSPAKPASPMLVIRSDAGFAGLLIDRVIGQREVVVRPMEDPLIQARGISGATELGDGRPVLVLDALALLEGAVRPLSSQERLNTASSFATSTS